MVPLCSTLLCQFSKVGLHLLQFTGLMPCNSRRKASKLVCKISFLHFLLSLLSHMFHLIVTEDKSFESVVPTILRLILITSIIIKSIIIISRRKEIRELHIFWEGQRGIKEYTKKFTTEIRIIYAVYALSLILTGSFWLISPTVSEGINKISQTSQKLPLGGWYPIDINNTYSFYLLYFHQIMTMALAGSASHGCNLIFLTIVIFISKLLVYFNMQLEKVPQQENIASSIEDCVKLKIKINKFVHDTRKVFSNLAFIHIVQATTTLVISSFQATTPGTSIKQKVFYMQGGFTHLVYLYLVCRYGSEIIYQSQLVNRTIYFWPWEDWKMEDIERMQMMASTNQKPLKVKAGLYTISLEFFVSACGVAGTSFLLLSSIRNSKF